MNASEVTAVLVTRGDVDLQPIIDSLLDYDDVIVWGDHLPNWRVAGRYIAALAAETDLVYWQDDDTIVPAETQASLLEEYAGEDCLANWAHGDNPDGYDDLPLVGAGAIADWRAAWGCIARYGARYPLDESFMYEADFVVGALYPCWRHVRLPFEIRDVAYNGRRLADEPWQRDLKFDLTERARAIRIGELVAA